MSFRGTVLAIAATVSMAGSLAAQGTGSQALEIRVRGGGYNALTNFNDLGTADTKLGFNTGATIGLQLNKYVALRTDFTFARDEQRTGAIDTGDHLNKYAYTGAIQLQYPSAGGVTPYILAGAGGITIHQENSSGLNKSKVAGVGGVGISYRIPNSRFAVFTEGLGYLYQLRDFGGTLAGFDKTQFDAAWSAGFSYSIGL
jgi:opacity protein-like surface antigen